MEEPLKIIAATQGTFILNDNTIISGHFDGFVTLEDTIFEFIELDGDNVTTEYISNPLLPVKMGAVIRPKNPSGQTLINRFTRVRLISGSIAVIL